MSELRQHSGYYLLILLLIAYSFGSINGYGVNIPHWDDHAIRVFVNNFKLNQFFEILSYHNEHRIAFTRFVALLIDIFHGNLDFKIMMYVGNLGLVGLMICFIYIKNKFSLPNLFILGLACFIFNSSTFENTLWAMAAVQNHWVLFWSTASTLLLIDFCKKQDSKIALFWLAILCSAGAIFTSGNGVIMAPIGLIILSFLAKRKHLLIWILIHALFLAFYFWSFESNGAKPTPTNFLVNLLTLLGSFIYPFFNHKLPLKLPMCIGFLSLTFSAIVLGKLFLTKGSKEKFITYLSLMAFFIGTLFLVSISRSEYQLTVLLSSKYKIYSFLILGTSLLFGVKNEMLSNNKIFLIALACILVLFLNAETSFKNDIKNTYQERVSDAINVKLQQPEGSEFAYQTFFFEPILRQTKSILDENKIDSISLEKMYARFFDNSLTKKTDSYVFLKSLAQEKLISMEKHAGIFEKVSKGQANLLLYNFPTDIYQIFYLEVFQKKATLYNTDKTVRITGVEYIEEPKNW